MIDESQPQPDRSIDGAMRTEIHSARRVRHWQREARRREEAMQAIRRRPLVRLAMKLDPPTTRVVRRLTDGTNSIRRRGWRLLETVAALRNRPRLAGRRALLAARNSQGSTTDSAVLLIVIGDLKDPPALVGRPGVVQLIMAPDSRAARSRCVAESSQVVGEAGQASTVEMVQAAVEKATSDLVCVIEASMTPSDGSWLNRLASLLDNGVGAVTPRIVHAERPWVEATRFDLTVCADGLVVQRSVDGEPRLRYRHSGQELGHDHGSGEDEGSDSDEERGTVDVLATSSGCVVFDRQALQAVGGLDHNLGIEAAVVDACIRMRASGYRVVCDEDTLVFDHRPVHSHSDLIGPLPDASSDWRAIVERHGAELLWKPGSPPRPPDFVFTVASPSAKVAPQWGDWHLAEAMARALRAAGHPARVQTAGEADSLAGRTADVHVVLRGLAPIPRTPGQSHVLWIISHPEDVDLQECHDADLVLVASRRFADSLRAQTSTPVEVLLQATDPDRFRPRRPDPRHRHRVTIVAKSRDVMRPMVADAVEAGLRPSIYGTGWDGLVDPALLMAGHVPNEELAVVYSSAGVVLNDHWDSMREWGFVSNRVFDVLACGAPLISDDLPELAEIFGDLVPTWRTAEQLKAAVDEIFADPTTTARRSLAARSEVLRSHTFAHRARELLRVLGTHRLIGDQGQNMPPTVV